jgi:peroxiredoxin
MDPVARVGSPAPDFALRDLDGGVHRLADARGRVRVLVFWSAECPHSERADQILASLRPGWGRRVVVWWVASNANEEAERLRAAARHVQAEPVLVDADQSVADLYGALTTPHVFVLDAAGVLRYAGAPDDVAFRQPAPTRHYLADAVQALLDGRNPDPDSTSPFGCALVRAFGPARRSLTP